MDQRSNYYSCADLMKNIEYIECSTHSVKFSFEKKGKLSNLGTVQLS